MHWQVQRCIGPHRPNGTSTCCLYALQKTSIPAFARNAVHVNASSLRVLRIRRFFPRSLAAPHSIKLKVSLVLPLLREVRLRKAKGRGVGARSIALARFSSSRRSFGQRLCDPKLSVRPKLCHYSQGASSHENSQPSLSDQCRKSRSQRTNKTHGFDELAAPSTSQAQFPLRDASSKGTRHKTPSTRHKAFDFSYTFLIYL